jgi:hypothetical protein
MEFFKCFSCKRVVPMKDCVECPACEKQRCVGCAEELLCACPPIPTGANAELLERYGLFTCYWT